MTTPRKIALVVAGLAGLCLLLLIALPLLFRGAIERRVKAQVNRSVDAQVEWTGVSLSLLHDFPNLTVGLEDLSVAGTGRFQGDTLLALPRFRLVLDLGSVLGSLRGGSPIVVRAVELDRPAVRLAVLEDGTPNWDIMRPSPAAEQPGRPLALSLRSLEVRDARLTLDNRQSRLRASVAGLNESLQGDFTRQRFTLKTRTTADTVSLAFAGVPYLNQVRLGVGADVDADMGAKRFTLKGDTIRLNDLLLAFSGSLAQAPDSAYDLDLKFAAPRTDFRDILSLVPAIYAHDFARLRTSGSMALSGWVRGRYGPKAFPALALQAKVENGSFRYPDLPLPARDIALDLALSNPGGSVDATVLDVRRLHLVVGANPVDATLVLRTPVSDPDVQLRLAGKLDLADVGRTIELPQVDSLTGVITADAALHARQSDVTAQRYDRVDARGSVDVRSLVLQAKDLPHAVRIADASLKLSPQHAELASFNGTIGRSDLSATGFLDNLVGYAFHDEPLRGQARLASRYFDLNEWRSRDSTQAVMVPAHIDFALDATVDRLTYGALELRDAHGTVRIKDRRATLSDFQVGMLGGTVALNGFYETTDTTRPTFDLHLGVSNVSVPGAFAGIKTVQAFAPVAQYAQGQASADLQLDGALGRDMMPVLGVLSGLGSFRTAGLELKDFPPMDRLASLLKVDQLKNPALTDLASSFEIKDGKLHVKPFDVRIGQLAMNVSGSNGIDRSLDYTLALKLPRAALGSAANQAVAALAAKSKQVGLDLQAADVVTVGVKLGGTITNPSISTSLLDATRAGVQGVQQALQVEATRRVDSARARVDSAAAATAARARARADSIVAGAERKAAQIRADARALADTVRSQGYARADSLAARPTDPLARLAAKAAADRLRKETDTQVNRLVGAADARADSLVAAARRQAAEVAPAP